MPRATVKFLTPELGYLFRITHIANVPWILDHGLHCRKSQVQDPNFREIGKRDLIDKRHGRAVPAGPGGTLADYVPFYLTPYSPMLLNVKTGRGGVPPIPMADIVILVASVPRLVELGVPFLLTDRHAYLQTTKFTEDARGLELVDWDVLREREFARSDDDPGRFERYQAEALVHRCVPVSALVRITCYGDEQQAIVEAELTKRGLALPVVARPEWYF